MYLDTNNIHRNVLVFEHELELGDLEGAGPERMMVRGARLSGEAERSDRGIDLEAHLDATVVVGCSRCTEPFAIPLSTDFSLTLVPEAERTEQDDREVGDEEVRFFYTQEGKADLSSMAAEQIYLNLPLKPICHDTCKGLCPVCGVNRNIEECACSSESVDPLLAPLLKFKTRRTPPSAR
jgi:uncharacterized protein